MPLAVMPSVVPPLPLSEAIPSVADLTSDAAFAEAFSDLAPLLGASTTEEAARLARTAAPDSVRDTLQDAFEQECGRLAADLARSSNVATWQREMMAAIRSHTLGQCLLGRRGQIPPAEERRRLGERLQEQTAYLSRFADENAERLAALPE